MASVFSASLEGLGRPAVQGLIYILKLVQLVFFSFHSTLFEKPGIGLVVLKVIAAQIYFTGFQAMPLISMLALATGGVIILNTSGVVTGNLFYIIVVRELGPLITGLIVIARSGTAVASELGNMKANQEMDALYVMGIDPLSYIVFPRLAGGVIAILCLAFYFDAVAMIGGFVMTNFFNGVPLEFFVNALIRVVTAGDLATVVLKNMGNGFIIFSIACLQGIQLEGGSHRVPPLTTKAVVLSIGTVTLFDLAVTAFWQFVQSA